MQNQTLKDVPSCDRAELLDRLDNDEDLLREIIGIFLTESPSQIGSLSEALSAGDRQAVERRAHRLKGAAGNISAGPLSELAHRIEIAAREGTLPAVGPLVTALEREYKALRSELTGMVRTEG